MQPLTQSPSVEPLHAISASPPEMAAAVKAAIDVCAASPLPMAVWPLGAAEPIVNEACAALVHAQHEGARSQAWCAIEQDMQTVMQTGQVLMREGVSPLPPLGGTTGQGLGTYALQPLLEQGLHGRYLADRHPHRPPASDHLARAPNPCPGD